MEAILTQLDFELARFDAEPESIETVFIGGGTPSTVAPEAYHPFFEKIKPFLRADAEITTEANPNSATPIWLKGMHNLGINRVSFGVQSFDDKKLKLLGRNHNAAQAYSAPNFAQEAGFEHISVDLIYGTHIDDRSLLQKDLETALSLPIDHLSAYSLTIEEGTLFQKRPEVSRDDENLAYWFTEQIKTTLPQYEISNFGTYRSRHNLGYWEYKAYIGIGSGAVGFLKNRRFYPTPSIEEYISDPLEIRTETLDLEAIKSEKVLLGLRSVTGVATDLLTKKELERAYHLIEAEKLYQKGGRLYNSNYLLSDEIALYLLS
jgi:oxygen-independent coproporphyrinogen-3 oxidase